MHCPYCLNKYGAQALLFSESTDTPPSFAPSICGQCGQLFIMESGKPRVLTSEEGEYLKVSPIGQALRIAYKKVQEHLTRHSLAANSINN